MMAFDHILQIHSPDCINKNTGFEWSIWRFWDLHKTVGVVKVQTKASLKKPTHLLRSMFVPSNKHTVSNAFLRLVFPRP